MIKKIKITNLWLVLVLLTSNLSLSAQEGTVIDGIIAVVGDKIILKSELENQLVSLKSQGIIIDNESKCQIIEELLYQKLLLHHAVIDSVSVTDAQVDGEMNRRLNYFISQIGSEKKLEQYYKKPTALGGGGNSFTPSGTGVTTFAKYWANLPANLKTSADADWVATAPAITDSQIVFTAKPLDASYKWTVTTTVTPTGINSTVVKP